MPLPSSQTSSSPGVKRKQSTLASFFTKKPQAAQPAPVNVVEEKTPATTPEKADNQERAPKKDTALTDDEEDDIVAPAAKRARTNGLHPASKEEVPKSTSTTERPPALTSSQRTEIFKFSSSPAVKTGAEGPQAAGELEARQRQKEREALHQKFVRKLGGADCLIGIGRNAISEATPEEGAEAEDEEEAAPPPAKGKAAAKKGGSKLTPMEKQVIDIKRKHMDTVLVVEVGYKFRFFGEDARVAAKELSIVCIPGKLRFDERKYGSVASFPSPALLVNRA